MKKFTVSLITVCCLLGAPQPSLASSNPMFDMMRMMMEMFLWMMGGSGRSYGSGYGGYPSGWSSYGNPYGMGYPSMPWGTGLSSYSSMFSPYSGYSGINPYGYNTLNPYASPWAGSQLSGWNNYYNWINPYDRYGSSYYNRYRSPYRKAPVVVQPIIVKQQTPARKKKTGRPVTVSPTPDERTADVGVSRERSRDYDLEHDNPMLGAWYGVNGEYLELGEESFRMLAGDDYLEGYYQVSNGIMKVKLLKQDDPVYFMIRLRNRELLFESENGQLMLFRRIGPTSYSYSPGTYSPPVNDSWR